MSVTISTRSDTQKTVHHWWLNFIRSLGPEYDTISVAKVTRALSEWNAVLIPPKADLQGRWYMIKFNSEADQTMFMLRWA